MDTLRDLRKASGMSVAEVARVLGITCSAYSNYEQGIRSVNISQVIPLAKLYDCSEKEVIEAAINSQLAR